MEVRENIMVPLGYGKFARSDKIISLEPIEDDRGPVGPMLRKSIKKEADFDLDKIEKRINEILRHEIEFGSPQ